MQANGLNGLRYSRKSKRPAGNTQNLLRVSRQGVFSFILYNSEQL